MSKGPTQIDAQAHLDQVTADTSDAVRKSAQEKRHAKGFRTARENLADLVDDDSFVGAIAAKDVAIFLQKTDGNALQNHDCFLR